MWNVIFKLMKSCDEGANQCHVAHAHAGTNTKCRMHIVTTAACCHFPPHFVLMQQFCARNVALMLLQLPQFAAKCSGTRWCVYSCRSCCWWLCRTHQHCWICCHHCSCCFYVCCWHCCRWIASCILRQQMLDLLPSWRACGAPFDWRLVVANNANNCCFHRQQQQQQQCKCWQSQKVLCVQRTRYSLCGSICCYLLQLLLHVYICMWLLFGFFKVPYHFVVAAGVFFVVVCFCCNSTAAGATYWPCNSVSTAAAFHSLHVVVVLLHATTCCSGLALDWQSLLLLNVRLAKRPLCPHATCFTYGGNEWFISTLRFGV